MSIKKYFQAFFALILFSALLYSPLSSAAWRALPGQAKDIAIGGNNSVWAVGTNRKDGGYGIYNWNGRGWNQVQGGAEHITVDNQGMPWVINSRGNIFRWTGSSWIKLPGFARDIAIGGNNSVWVVGTNRVDGGYGIYNWNGRGWTQAKGGAERIAVDNQGKPWVVNAQGNIFKWDGWRWIKLPGRATDIAIGQDNRVWVVGTNRRDGGYDIYHWRGNGWQKVDGSAVRIAVAKHGRPWVVNSRGQIFERKEGRRRGGFSVQFND